MSSQDDRQNYSGSVKKSIQVRVSKEIAWKKISNIVGLSWVLDVKSVIFLSKTKQGVGAKRKITFNNGDSVEEIAVGWKDDSYFSYIATSGLPLRAYHATISIIPIGKKLSEVTWQSFFNSEIMSKKEFVEFQNFMKLFYKNSLVNLKLSLEK